VTAFGVDEELRRTLIFAGSLSLLPVPENPTCPRLSQCPGLCLSHKQYCRVPVEAKWLWAGRCGNTVAEFLPMIAAPCRTIVVVIASSNRSFVNLLQELSKVGVIGKAKAR
jgi:hypothetical protein